MKTNQLHGSLLKMPVLLCALSLMRCGGDGGAADGGKSAPFTLQPTAAESCLNTVVKGQSRRLTAVMTQPDGSRMEVSTLATWSATDLMGTNVAMVSASGLVLGTELGQATITARYLGQSASSIVQVMASAVGPCPGFPDYYAVWGSDTCNVWAAAPGRGATIKKCDGKAWTVQGGPYDYTMPTGFGAMWGLDVNNVWVVGDAGTNLIRTGFISKWEGGGWSYQSAGLTDRRFSKFNNVWAYDLNHAWVVGDSGDIRSWDGSSWTQIMGITHMPLYGVWGSDPSNVWAVGGGGTILKWDGKTWTPQVSGTSETLQQVGGFDATHVWATGDGVSLKWDGVAWKP